MVADPNADTVREHISKTVEAGAAVRKAAADAADAAALTRADSEHAQPGAPAGGGRG